MICSHHDFTHNADKFLSHLLPPYDGGRLGWGWTSWIFPPHLNPPPQRGEEIIFLTQLGCYIAIY
jgi:hypothetical protein